MAVILAVLAGLPALPALPGLCGPLHDLTGRGYEGRCDRAHRLYMLHNEQAVILKAHKRLEVLTKRGRTHNAKHLTAWIVDATERHERLTTRILAEWSECTHPEHERGELSVEDALPGCTC